MEKILTLFKFSILASLKLATMAFYRFDQQWFSSANKQQWQEVKLIVFLNHTSLFEPLFIRLAPYSFLWRIASNLVVPGADITMKRPVTGKILRTLIPGCIPISRERDHTWQKFLNYVDETKITAILPEGRMKRRGGLDKYGQPMSVRGGVVDILERLHAGNILFLYSGGLHHIQAPGDRLPKLFKTIKVNVEIINLQTYKRQFSQKDNESFRSEVLDDMALRLTHKVPK
jgi:hypothetical protein